MGKNYIFPMPTIPLLKVHGLTLDFLTNSKSMTVVEGVSFHLEEAETLAIVGESGSGKSVTALSLLQLIPSPPGWIREGKALLRIDKGLSIDLLRLPEEQMRNIRGSHISMIFQEPMTSLNPVFTCGDQVSEALIEHLHVTRKEAKEKTLELFEEVCLTKPLQLFSSYPHQLSGGQKQRVMIAMAISCNPRILIADEPTTALDVTVQKTILELLSGIQKKRKMSILFITHDLGLISNFADRVMVMYQGKIVETGKTQEIFTYPVHPYTKGLLACRPPLDVRLRRLPTIDDFINSGGLKENREVVFADEREKNHRQIYSKPAILEVSGLGKNFTHATSAIFGRSSTVSVLEKISFKVFPGETLGIVGESGSGKTTLARTMLELIPPSEGRISFNQEDITQIGLKKFKRLRKDLQIIFQDPYSSLNPRISIGSAIIEPMLVHHLHGSESGRKEKAYELLRLVGLNEEYFFRYPHELSGGQRQRICIARVLAVEPRLIICDESVSALDVSIQAQVLNLLNELKIKLSLTYIFISHDLSVVRFMADRIIVMRNGKIEEIGEADEVFIHPKSEYTRCLLAAIPLTR